MEVCVMTEKSKNTSKDGLKMALLTILLAIPGMTVLIIRFLSDRLGETGALRITTMLIGEIGSDMTLALVIMSFAYLIKFTSKNPSYKNYSTKSNFTFAKFVIVFLSVCYIIKILLYIFKTDGVDIATLNSIMFTGFGLSILLYPIVLSDNNISCGWRIYSIERIKLDNVDEIERANTRHEDYVDLRFHYDDKDVKSRIKRTEMTELLEIMKGVGK
jgi:hypothetical protein